MSKKPLQLDEFEDDYQQSNEAIDWDGVERFGNEPDPAETEEFVATLERPRLATHCSHLMKSTEKQDVMLIDKLFDFEPDWIRGAQGIGDCVSWGWELGDTIWMAIASYLGLMEWQGTAATESIYGGCRVEAAGGRLGGYRDGAFGGYAAKWHTNWGVLLRKDYSQETGIPEHNLTKYSSKKAKAWGNFGCGGKDDAGREDGKLDKLAKLFPAIGVTRVLHTDELDAAMRNGYPVPTCSGVGYGNMKRNSDGVVRASGRWPHCMLFAGVRWVKGRRQFRQFQSWGRSCSGPDPGITIPAISWCSWWTTEEDAQRQLNARDSFAIGGINGFPEQKLDWAEAALSWNWGRDVTGLC